MLMEPDVRPQYGLLPVVVIIREGFSATIAIQERAYVFKYSCVNYTKRMWRAAEARKYIASHSSCRVGVATDQNSVGFSRQPSAPYHTAADALLHTVSPRDPCTSAGKEIHLYLDSECALNLNGRHVCSLGQDTKDTFLAVRSVPATGTLEDCGGNGDTSSANAAAGTKGATAGGGSQGEKAGCPFNELPLRYVGTSL